MKFRPPFDINRILSLVMHAVSYTEWESSKWSRVTAGVPQCSVLGPLFFLVYINDLVDSISADVRLFANDTSLFTIVYDEYVAADQLNRDLKTISDWAYLWKMQFNPDKTKQAVQVIF